MTPDSPARALALEGALWFRSRHMDDDPDRARKSDALDAAIVQCLEAVADTTHIWAAGEASAMHAIRTHLFKELGLDRSVATVRGYWKPAR